MLFLISMILELIIHFNSSASAFIKMVLILRYFIYKASF